MARSGKDAAATAKPDTLCAACIAAIQQDRDALPHLQEAVKVFVGIKPVTAMVSKVSSTPTPSSPLNLSAESLVADIGEVLSRVGNYLVRDLVSQPASRFKRWKHDVEQLVYWDGVDLALQVRRVHARAVKLLGFEREWTRKKGVPCWSCEQTGLGQWAGSETIECSNCGSRKTDAEYKSYCIELLAKGK